MNSIPIQISKKVFNKVYHPLINDTNRRRVLYGGRDSGKSDLIAADGVIDCLSLPYFKGILIRKWYRTIKESNYEKIKQVIERWGLQSEFRFLKNPLEIVCKNGNRFVGVGMDDPMKAKSFTDPTWAWYEECDQLARIDYKTTTKGLRNSMGTPIKEWFSFNSGNAKAWPVKEFFPPIKSFEREDGTHTYIESPREGVTILHTNYTHNDFITQDRIREYEYDRDNDPEEYRKSGLGLFSKSIEGLIYPDYDIIESFPYNLAKVQLIGGDFGFTDPNAFCRVGWGARKKDLFIDELIYEGNLDDNELIAKMRSVGIEKHEKGYLDSSEPGTIKAINKAGYRGMLPAKKDKGSIMSGIKKVKSFNIRITKRSVNVIDEIDVYSMAKNKQGEYTGVPVDFNNHLMDAIRYPVYTDSHKGDFSNLVTKRR